MTEQVKLNDQGIKKNVPANYNNNFPHLSLLKDYIIICRGPGKWYK